MLCYEKRSKKAQIYENSLIKSNIRKIGKKKLKIQKEEKTCTRNGH